MPHQAHPPELPLIALSDNCQSVVVDDCERPARNSKGDLIHWSEEGVRNFWRWFKGSQVVDADGRPLVVHHGTREVFTEFKKGRSVNFSNPQRLLGFFFAEDRKYAEQYAQGNDGGLPGVVMPVYLRIASVHQAPSARIDALEGASDRNARAFAKRLRDKGADGIRFGEGSIAEWVAFSNLQIKSAAGDNWAFDVSSASIVDVQEIACAPVADDRVRRTVCGNNF